ncbi:hypothetical protein L9F63_005438, partial [Diploptera punctata]
TRPLLPIIKCLIYSAGPPTEYPYRQHCRENTAIIRVNRSSIVSTGVSFDIFILAQQIHFTTK